MSVIPASERRTTTTPNATMTTLCSPTLGGSAVAVWRTEMAPGSSGPWHRLDQEQVVTVVAGALDLEREGLDPTRLGPGDTAVLPAHRLRRLHAGDDQVGAETVSVAVGPVEVVDGDGADHGTPPWMA